MPSDVTNIYVDSTFDSPSEGNDDTTIDYKLASPDVIGAYSIPVIYRNAEAIPSNIDVELEYMQVTSTVSGVVSIVEEYFVHQPPTLSGVTTCLVDYATQTAISGTYDKQIIYTTGYNAVSGTLNRRVIFTAGREFETTENKLIVYRRATTTSGYEDIYINHTNFTGDMSNGYPLPTYSGLRNYTKEYTAGSGIADEYDRIIDISFGGWVDYPFYADVYSVDLGLNELAVLDVTTISGNVQVHYLDVFSSALTVSGISSDVYCALIDYANINFEAATISGTIGYIVGDIYSTALKKDPITLDVDLYSLKITNFSLGIGEYTTASGFISVDVEDDECAVSVSGTYMMVDGQQVTTTFTAISDGYRLTYDPANDFEDIEGPTTITIHAENECGKSLEQDYYLTFGYFLEFVNSKYGTDGLDFGYLNKIGVRITAEDYATCPTLSSEAWEFESRPMVNRDLTASIQGVPYGFEYKDLTAEIYPQSTAYFYEKEFTIIVNARDFNGNEMEPFILTYRIEDKP